MRERRFVGQAAFALLSVLLVGFACRWFDTDWTPLVVLAALWPVVVLVGALGLALAAAARWWRTTAAAAALVLAASCAEAPIWFGSADPGGHRLAVAQANLYMGKADPAAFVRQVRDLRPDVLTLNELNPDELAALRAAGLDEILPYSYTLPGLVRVGTTELYTACETAIFSRHPLSGQGEFKQPGGGGFVNHALTALAQTPWGQVRVVAVHTLAVWTTVLRNTGWAYELKLLAALLPLLPRDERVVVAGDLNATYDHAAFRALLADGYADAGAQAGAGIVPTWEQGTAKQLFEIDHVLTRNGTGTGFRSFPIQGSDHLGVVATVAFS
ncbi:endonuclease/exonuclease/phosphatase family protein [Segniliparus rugosus]|uniref:Endonuclease/exonuclease/phosphatase domain-containing protein n=1 Tax=Segniliparus rugosus (strain ATCC BAA-974 / DSM 45345 / CCUG 50838 / CIP 108380 / JCM 13579 / CDC 945) TaxID=679197 RepID=E5XSJ2_SEGRC|nr:endonuclease/exonuclease/phosphatase family protein [Segniliparus rugosus]EFV12669.1 hypothetical protein HMPREF9336_02464 [Segniliparus rugosus ATCC BAA-974]